MIDPITGLVGHPLCARRGAAYVAGGSTCKDQYRPRVDLSNGFLLEARIPPGEALASDSISVRSFCRSGIDAASRRRAHG